MSTNVLLTTVGGKTSPSLIKSLTSVNEREITVVGSDPVSTLPGEFMVNAFYETAASFEDADAFLADIEQIIETENIDLIIPCTNEEALLLAEHRERIESSSAELLSTEYEMLSRAFDKYLAYETISECAPAIAPEYHLVSSVTEFEAAVTDLDYPDSKVVLKPRHGRGGRGVLIVDPEMEFGEVLASKPGRRYPYEFVEQLIVEYDWNEDVIVMEYLPGDIYSTYSLCCDRGNTVLTLIHERLWGTASQTLKSRIVEHEAIETAVEKINAEFKFEYNINYEFKSDADGNPILYDLNPRMAASTAVFRAVDVNLPYLSVKLALGDDVTPEVDETNVVMMRYLQEFFLDETTQKTFEL